MVVNSYTMCISKMGLEGWEGHSWGTLIYDSVQGNEMISYSFKFRLPLSQLRAFPQWVCNLCLMVNGRLCKCRLSGSDSYIPI